jgi:hypothetical protein
MVSVVEIIIGMLLFFFLFLNNHFSVMVSVAQIVKLWKRLVDFKYNNNNPNIFACRETGTSNFWKSFSELQSSQTWI